jgi:hypothetical protein
MLRVLVLTLTWVVIAGGVSRSLAAENLEKTAESAGYGDVQCSCRACAHDVCCKAPTGFAPLDDTCKGECETRKWVAKDGGSCGKQAGCCP